VVDSNSPSANFAESRKRKDTLTDVSLPDDVADWMIERLGDERAEDSKLIH